MQLVGAGSEPSVDSQCIVIDYVYVRTQCLDALYGRLRVAAHLYAAQRRASLGQQCCRQCALCVTLGAWRSYFAFQYIP